MNRFGLLSSAIVLLVAFVASGCAVEELPNEREVPPSITGCPNGSLEGCFNYNEMSGYLETVTPMVREYFREQYPRVADPRDVVYVASGRQGRSPCGNVVNGDSYEYCGADDTIYIGQDLLWAFYHEIGDAAPVVGLAHEWAHHLQVTQRVPLPRTAKESVDFENQADCIAGAWARYADEKGWLEREDDLADVTSLLNAIGSRESGNRDHGTPRERIQAFDLGFEDGVRACNTYTQPSPG